jgi:hypothetical protein
MIETLLRSFLLGLDGFVVCLALGPLSTYSSWPDIRREAPLAVLFGLAALFGLCDGVALLAGNSLEPLLPWAGTFMPALIGLWSVLVLLLVILDPRPLLPLVPLLLGFDNLLTAAVSGQTIQPDDAALSATVSAVLAAAGLLAGRAVIRRMSPAPTRLAGASVLLAVGVVAIAA